jgi:hypothetical protein
LITNTCPIAVGPFGTVVVVVAIGGPVDGDVEADATVVDDPEAVDDFEDDEHAPNTSMQLTIAIRVFTGRA